jgi:hypothetical protein
MLHLYSSSPSLSLSMARVEKPEEIKSRARELWVAVNCG